MTSSNLHPLGYKQAAGYADDALGSIGEFEDVNLNQTTLGPKKRKSGITITAILVQSTNASPMKPGSLARFALPGTTVGANSGAAAVVDGVVDPYLTEDVAQNDVFWLIIHGIVPVLAGGVYSANGALASDASGKAVTATGGTATNFGRAIEAGVLDNLKRAYVDCRTF